MSLLISICNGALWNKNVKTPLQEGIFELNRGEQKEHSPFSPGRALLFF
jgi:hypothetical protein